MSKSISKILDDLRGKLGAAEQRQVELNAEILEISWAANTGDAKAKARIDAITNELASGLTGLPQHPDLLAPNERHSVADLTTAWAAQVRHVIATLETAAEAA
jgi:hypothetical protein